MISFFFFTYWPNKVECEEMTFLFNPYCEKPTSGPCEKLTMVNEDTEENVINIQNSIKLGKYCVMWAALVQLVKAVA